MEHHGAFPSRHGLEHHGLHDLRRVFWSLSPAQLCEHALCRGEGRLSASGTLVALTGSHTGRSPNDKFVVRRARRASSDIWWGKVNRPISTGRAFDRLLRRRLGDYLAGKDLFVFDGYAGADPRSPAAGPRHHRVRLAQPVRPEHVPARADPEALGAFAARLHRHRRPGLQRRPGERRHPLGRPSSCSTSPPAGAHRRHASTPARSRSRIFTVMNYLLPKQDVLSMHCSANYGARQGRRGALLRPLGHRQDHPLGRPRAHASSATTSTAGASDGVFNFEGGCYAKVIRLSAEGEPEI